MKVNLIFTPWCNPSYLPVGIAYIKSYIEKYSSSVKIRNIDLNNEFFNSIDRDFHRIETLCNNCNNKTCAKVLLGEQFKDHFSQLRILYGLFKDKYLFNQPEFYNQSVMKMRSLYLTIQKCYEYNLKEYLETKDAKLKKMIGILIKSDIHKIISNKPDVVGFSIFSIEQLLYSLVLAEFVKKGLKVKIVFGGAALAHLECKKILELFGNVIDYIIVKEGELPLLKLIDYFKGDISIEQVPSTIYLRRKKLYINNSDIVKDINTIPFPDYNDFGLNNYFSPYPVLPILFSRGCYWNRCTFCSHHKSYVHYRSRSVDDVVNEIRLHSEKGIKFFWFSDETILSRDIIKLSDALIANKIKIYFHMMLRPEKMLSDKQVLKNLYKAGLRFVIWGMESFSPRVLMLMNKGTEPDCFEKILKSSSEAGIKNIVYLIQGFPLQKEEEVLEDIRIIQKNKQYITGVTFHRFWLEQGSYIYSNPREFGIYAIGKKPFIKINDDFIPKVENEYRSEQTIDWEKINAAINEIKYPNKFKDSWSDILIHSADLSDSVSVIGDRFYIN